MLKSNNLVTQKCISLDLCYITSPLWQGLQMFTGLLAQLQQNLPEGEVIQEFKAELQSDHHVVKQ